MNDHARCSCSWRRRSRARCRRGQCDLSPPTPVPNIDSPRIHGLDQREASATAMDERSPPARRSLGATAGSPSSAVTTRVGAEHRREDRARLPPTTLAVLRWLRSSPMPRSGLVGAEPAVAHAREVRVQLARRRRARSTHSQRASRASRTASRPTMPTMRDQPKPNRGGMTTTTVGGPQGEDG